MRASCWLLFLSGCCQVLGGGHGCDSVTCPPILCIKQTVPPGTPWRFAFNTTAVAVNMKLTCSNCELEIQTVSAITGAVIPAASSLPGTEADGCFSSLGWAEAFASHITTTVTCRSPVPCDLVYRFLGRSTPATPPPTPPTPLPTPAPTPDPDHCEPFVTGRRHCLELCNGEGTFVRVDAEDATCTCLDQGRPISHCRLLPGVSTDDDGSSSGPDSGSDSPSSAVTAAVGVSAALVACAGVAVSIRVRRRLRQRGVDAFSNPHAGGGQCGGAAASCSTSYRELSAIGSGSGAGTCSGEGGGGAQYHANVAD
jgi:hypothetical protein